MDGFTAMPGEIVTLALTGTGCHGLHVVASAQSAEGAITTLFIERVLASGAKAVKVEHEFPPGALDGSPQLLIEPVVYGNAGADYALAISLCNESDPSPTVLFTVAGTLMDARGDTSNGTGFDAPLLLVQLVHPEITKARRTTTADALDDVIASIEDDFSMGVPPQQSAQTSRAPSSDHVFPEDDGAKLYPLWYGTNRTRALSDGSHVGYSAFRDSDVHYGRCTVRIPRSHKIGQTGSPFWKRIVALSDDRLTLTKLGELQEARFWTGVAEQIRSAQKDSRHAVVFIHGYNVSFEDAAIRAAQLGCDLAIEGVMAFYSWPSRGTLDGYFADEATIQASAKYITAFLENIVQRAGAEQVHVVAHSMGNRAALEAVREIVAKARERTGVQFAQFILAAPDVDAEYFLQFADAYTRVARRTTMYVSDRDHAIKASRFLHGGVPRVGLAPPFQVVKGIDTIYAGKVDDSTLGHGYVATAWQLLNDMHQLIHLDAEPKKRSWVTMADSNDHWVLKGVV